MSNALWPRQVKLFESYLDWNDSDEAVDLRESGHSTDFATYAGAVVGKRVMQVYRETPSIWPSYAGTYNVPDFKPISFVGLTEGEDLIEFQEGGEYYDSKIAERVGATLTVRTFGRLFSISRKALINDDLGLLRDAPGRLGRSAARTLNRLVVGKLETPGNAYDGRATFHNDHGNLMSEALSEASLGTAALKFAAQTDDNGNPINLIPRLLLLPPALEITARRILNSTEIHTQGGAATAPVPLTTAVYGMGNANVMQGYVPYAVERYLTDVNNWYLIADPNEAPVIAVGFLNGQRDPQVMLNDPGMRMTLGGSDPYTMEFDTITWKVRHEMGAAIVDWRGIVCSVVA